MGNFSFEKTALWRASFGNARYKAEANACNALRECLIAIRERAQHLVSLVSRDIPGLTVHDVTHLDALWETASLIAGDDYPLNPAEAFVFGAAVLLHDSAMSLAAYPGGLDEVRRKPQWRDAVANRLLAATGEPIDQKQLDAPPDEIAKAALADVLRETHADRASELPAIEWPAPDGSREHLIQDSDLRLAYGNIIGEIAASHWLPVSELRTLQPRVNAGPKVPSEWFVSPLKIGCLLRVADAAHIDHRRAPRFLRMLLRPGQTSDVHWVFQAKLGKPSLDKNFLVYTGGPFNIDEAEAWWLCFDMLAAIDDELRAVHGVLDVHGERPFLATAVKAAKSPQAIAEFIRTKDWRPVNTELRVSDVPSLVELLGGQRLYGSDRSAPIRELIQNSSDAIRARRAMGELPEDSGRITVRLRRTESADWLDFDDDGIGMSSRVLTGPLLDFGRSFWRSALLRQEFPGLLSKGLKTTGRFGVGFFSIFMLGDHVTVTSRRYDAAFSDANMLEFQKGLRVRPILRKVSPSETSSQYMTRVSVALRNRFDEDGGLLFKGNAGDKAILIPLRELVSAISPALDVTIEIDECGRKQIAVAANDWLTEEAETLVERTAPRLEAWHHPQLKSLLSCFREMRDSVSGEVYGRGCLCGGSFYRPTGVVTVGGFRADRLHQIAGLLVGQTESVARSSAMPTVPAPVLREWATEQAQLIDAAKLSGHHKLQTASLVMLCGGDPGNLPITIRDGDYLTIDALESLLRNLEEVEVYEGFEIEYDEEDDVRPKAFENDFVISREVFLVPCRLFSILTFGDQSWPQCIPELYVAERPKSCDDAFHAAMKRVWGVIPDWEEDTRAVGQVHGDEIVRTVRVYSRPLNRSVLEDYLAEDNNSSDRHS